MLNTGIVSLKHNINGKNEWHEIIYFYLHLLVQILAWYLYIYKKYGSNIYLITTFEIARLLYILFLMIYIDISICFLMNLPNILDKWNVTVIYEFCSYLKVLITDYIV